VTGTGYLDIHNQIGQDVQLKEKELQGVFLGWDHELFPSSARKIS
jgi:hypothetical protein